MFTLNVIKHFKLIESKMSTATIVNCFSQVRNHSNDKTSSGDDCGTKKKTKKKERTPKGRFDDEFDESPLSYNEKEPLEKYPNATNPKTGEIGGPSGPEPTRYGDWERKGRVSDF